MPPFPRCPRIPAMSARRLRRIASHCTPLTPPLAADAAAPAPAAGDGERHGGRLLVQSLLAHNVDRVFAVPGESYLAVLDGLYDAPSVEVVICRQEGGAAMMAEADGKLKGTPGVAMVTRAPGATNASAGVHIAFQDSTPMVLLVGQVGRSMFDREAFQEVDYRKMFGPGVGLAKAAFEINAPERIPEYMNRAFALACSGRPGPVVLALPEDVLSSVMAEEPAVPLPASPTAPNPDPAAIAELGGRIVRPPNNPQPTRYCRALTHRVSVSGGAGGGAAPDHHRRRRGLDPRRDPSAGVVRRGLLPARGPRLPPPGRARQPPPVLHWPCRHRRRPGSHRPD